MVLGCDGVLGDGVVRECLRVATGVATPSSSAASAPTPAFAAAFTFSAFAMGLAVRLGCRRFGIFFFPLVCRDDGLVLFVCRRRNLRLLGGKIARRFRCVHLFAAIDHVGLLPGHCRVG